MEVFVAAVGPNGWVIKRLIEIDGKTLANWYKELVGPLTEQWQVIGVMVHELSSTEQ